MTNNEQSINMSLGALNESSIPAEIREQERKRRQAEAFKRYLDNTGISTAFQIIMAEIQTKNIKEDKVFEYTAARLRQIGADLSSFQGKDIK